MSPLVGKQAHQSQTPDIPCAKVTHPHIVLQYLYRHFGFFYSKLSLVPHLTFLYQHTPDSPLIQAAFPSSTQILRKTRAGDKSI